MCAGSLSAVMPRYPRGWAVRQSSDLGRDSGRQLSVLILALDRTRIPKRRVQLAGVVVDLLDASGRSSLTSSNALWSAKFSASSFGVLTMLSALALSDSLPSRRRGPTILWAGSNSRHCVEAYRIPRSVRKIHPDSRRRQVLVARPLEPNTRPLRKAP